MIYLPPFLSFSLPSFPPKGGIFLFGFDIIDIMIVVFTGNGKGKTTACLGQMIRALGQGKRAAMFQFIKGPWISGEHKFVDLLSSSLKKNFLIYRGGKGFVGILGDKLPFRVHQRAALLTLKKVQQAIQSKKWDLVVLDEVNVAVSLKLLKARDVLRVISQASPQKVIILSGRNAPLSFIRRADLVTEMKEIKHPYQKGKKALVGFEF
ncbi:MAG: cob(I)yrinic acid a,c-diamide adenosyltransferase [Patescibacteria group bacterium]|nr:cob(I)yrinic acid a,c-diamide adenosyltransferase [Patescibacteria group bacterium]